MRRPCRGWGACGSSGRQRSRCWASASRRTVRAEGRAYSNIEVANAIEAVACRLTYERHAEKGVWPSDARLRGGQKLRKLDDRGADHSYATMARPSAYVSQPLRMGTVRALPALGLVDATGARFNSFRTNDAARELIAEVFGRSRQRFNVVRSLTGWVHGDNDIPQPAVQKALDLTGTAKGAFRPSCAKRCFMNP